VVRNGVRDWLQAAVPDAGLAATMAAARERGGAVLMIARLAAPKRLDLFLRTAELLPDAAFFWIGNETEVDPSSLPPNVRMLGGIPDAGAYAKEADLLLLLSDYEGLPMSILEALSCGTPVVASKVGGVSEAVDGSCGELVPNDAAAIASAVARFLPGGARRAQGSGRYLEAARARYEERFSGKAMAAGYETLYRELLCMADKRNSGVRN
jgi:glycosyltransferase involved in cell wall biosynthesis